MSRDALDLEIEAVSAAITSDEAKYASLGASIERRRMELKTLQRAASLRPGGYHGGGTDDIVGGVVGAVPTALIKKRTGGRQPGAISQPWREALRRLSRAEKFDIEMLVLVAETVGLDKIKPSAARTRMNEYVAHGYVAFDGENYRVTDKAIQRFGLKKAEAPQAQTQEAP